MNRVITIQEARKIFGENCIETQRDFLIYPSWDLRRKLTFVVGKKMLLDANGEPLNPLVFYKDERIIKDMNVDFNGDAAFMFGQYFIYDRRYHRFRPRDPKHATDLLIRVLWGGPNDERRGVSESEKNKIPGVKHFLKCVSSTNNQIGIDYWVVPIGFKNIPNGEEGVYIARAGIFNRNAETYRKKYGKMYAKNVRESDEALRAKLAAEKSDEKDV